MPTLAAESQRFSAQFISKRLLIISVFIILSSIGQTFAQTSLPIPVLVKTYKVAGTAQRYVNGVWVPNPNVPVLVTTESHLVNPSRRFVIIYNTVVLFAGNDGRFEGATLPCHRDSSGQYNSAYVIRTQIIGATGGGNSRSGGWQCNDPDNAFLNMGPRGDTIEPDNQNLGTNCERRRGPVGELKYIPGAVGQPVNITNGNMWLAQSDYNLSGVGENIKINRFYNSAIQQPGMFGFGWKSDYDESISNFNNLYLTLRDGTGRGYYFAHIVNNIFQSASAGIYGQVVKNADNTYTLTLKDGRVRQFSSAGKLLWLKDRNGNQTTLSYDAGGNLTLVTDPFGRTLSLTTSAGRVTQIADNLGVAATYAYNANGTLQAVIYPDGSKYQFDYTVINNKTYLTTVRDALNNILETHQYDAQGRAITSEKQGGAERYTLDYSHIGDNAPYTMVTDGLGRITRYNFDKSKGRNAVTRVEGNCGCGGGSQATDYFYDNQLNLTKTVDALGREITYTYDDKGNPLTMTDAAGTEAYTYNNFGQVLTRRDRMNGLWTNTYDAQGKLLTATDPLNHVTTITYTAQGQVATLRDALNRVTGFGYDAQGRLAQATDANNKTTVYGYDARSRLTGVTNALNFATTFEYDGANRLKKTIHPDGKFILYGYDLAGRRTTATDERGFTTNYGYDGAYRLTSVTDALNHTSTVGYDSMSNPTSRTDALGNVTIYEYDGYDRLTKTVYPPAAIGATPLQENYEYDAVGNLKKRFDTAGRQTLFDYDALNRLFKTTDPNLQISLFEYNGRSQMTKVTDALGQQYLFAYDPLGRQLSQSRAGNTTSYTYDPVGNRLTRTDYKGTTTAYAYDNLNRLRQVQYPNQAENITYDYDDLSRLTNSANYAGTILSGYDNRNRLVSTTDVHNKVVGYSYDERSNRTELKLDGITQATYAYDQANRLAQITDETTLPVTFGYDNANRLISKTLPNNVATTYNYDGMSRLRQLKHQSQQTTLFDNQLNYNPANQISQIIEPNQTKTFGYDNLDRLTSTTYANQTQQNETYGYDPVGNRTASYLSASYSYQPFNRLSASQQASYVYDSNGNMVLKTDATGQTQYIWDFENRLRQVIKPDSTSVNYKYDALGRRTERYINTDSTKFTYDGEDVILDQNSDGSFVKYLNGLGIDDKIRQTVNGQAQYFQQDHLGSTVALTDATGAPISQTAYDSFGNATSSIPTRYQYTGREKDETTGLHYYRARWYDANLGRFISEDPIGFAGGDINLFAYVGNNSTNLIDPSGQSGRDRDYPINLGNGWRGAIDTTNNAGEGFEIHVVDPSGKERGIVNGRNGWIGKHGHSPVPPQNIPRSTLDAINGLNLDELRARGLVPARGHANVKAGGYIFPGRRMYGPMGGAVGILGLIGGLLGDYDRYRRAEEYGNTYEEQLREDTNGSEYLITPLGVFPNPYYCPMS